MKKKMRKQERIARPHALPLFFLFVGKKGKDLP